MLDKFGECAILFTRQLIRWPLHRRPDQEFIEPEPNQTSDGSQELKS